MAARVSLTLSVCTLRRMITEDSSVLRASRRESVSSSGVSSTKWGAGTVRRLSFVDVNVPSGRWRR